MATGIEAPSFSDTRAASAGASIGIEGVAQQIQDRGLRFRKTEVTRSNGIFDDDEGFALMLLRRKLEVRLGGEPLHSEDNKTLRPTDRRVQTRITPFFQHSLPENLSDPV